MLTPLDVSLLALVASFIALGVSIYNLINGGGDDV
jgi:hypothetical protein